MSEILIGSNPDNQGFIITDALGNPMPSIKPKEEVPIKDRGRQLPLPSGYRILCAIPDVEKEFDSGIIKPDQMVKYDELLSTVLFVVELGPDCYSDKERFPNGPWCKVGDFVMFRPNTGTRFKVNGSEYRIMNDDSIEAVVADPRGVTRA